MLAGKVREDREPVEVIESLEIRSLLVDERMRRSRGDSLARGDMVADMTLEVAPLVADFDMVVPLLEETLSEE